MERCVITKRKCTYNSSNCYLPKCTHYTEYRKATGLCNICGVEIATHKKCNSCGILVGRGHLEGYLFGDGKCTYCHTHKELEGKEVHNNVV